jgi:hypothetical protein
MNSNEKHHHAILQSIARRAMLERDLLPDFSAEALAELVDDESPTESREYTERTQTFFAGPADSVAVNK